jgi:hypothetical protein
MAGMVIISADWRDINVTGSQQRNADTIGSQSLAEYLRAATPRLILRVDPSSTDGLSFKIEPYISEIERPCENVIKEGYGPRDRVLGSTYWRIVKRGDELLYCSTFQIGRHEIINGWGARGLASCESVKGIAVARIETAVPADPSAVLPTEILGCRGELAGRLFLDPSLSAQISQSAQ